jgi:hypothetical protein
MTDANHECSGHGFLKLREPSEISGGNWRTERSLVPLGGENPHPRPRIEIALKTAAFRLRDARSGGEDHQLAVSQ